MSTAPDTVGPVRIWITLVRRHRRIRAGMRSRTATRDTALIAAGVTFYGGIALIPMLLLGLRMSTALFGTDSVLRYGDAIASVLPGATGAPGAVDALFEAGTQLGLLAAVVAILPATFYGEGMRRALLVYEPVTENYIGWRGRLLSLPVLIVAPLLLAPVLLAGNALASVTIGDGVSGVAASAFRVWLGFVTIWLVLAIPIGWTFRVVAPTRLSWTSTVVGALVTSSIVAGFLQGFVLFLAIPIPWSGPFGGLEAVGAVVALGLWLFLLHILVLMGWVFTLECDRLVVQERTATVGTS